MRALPRPQVRSVFAEGVLQVFRLLQQRPGEGDGVQVRQFAAFHSGADSAATGAASTAGSECSRGRVEIRQAGYGKRPAGVGEVARSRERVAVADPRGPRGAEW